MNIQISTTSVQYDDQGNVSTVQVHFRGHDDARTININGYIPLSAEEYQGNEALPKLVEIVKQNLVNRLAA